MRKNKTWTVATILLVIAIWNCKKKKAYDALEEQGFIVTVHGKGSFVSCANQELMLEEKRKEVEYDIEMAIRKGRSCGMNNQELVELFKLILEEWWND